MKKIGFVLVTILSIIILGVLLASFGVWYHRIHNQHFQLQVQDKATSTNPTTTITPVVAPTTQTTNTIVIPISTSTTAVINDQYGLFMTNPANHPEPFSYFSDGIINDGGYAGYQRIIVQDFVYGGEASVWNLIFATKDYKTFVIDKSIASQQILNNLAIGGDKGGIYINTAKVTGQGPISTAFPENINLGLFNLVNSYSPYTLDKVETADSIELTSSVPGLRFFYLNQPNADAQYDFSSYMSINVEDSAGVIESYLLDVPKVISSPYVGLGDIASSPLLYKSYGAMFPTMDNDGFYVLNNVSLTNLTKLGTTKDGLDIYSPKNSNDPLNKAAFQYKFSSQNGSSSAPSFDDYVAKHPVLLFKDLWGRWIGASEDYYAQQGGGFGN